MGTSKIFVRARNAFTSIVSGALRAGIGRGGPGSPARARKRTVSAIVLLGAALVGGCGGGDGGATGANGPATLKVGLIPIADVAPVYLGIDKGFFRDEKLTIKPTLAEGGAAITPAVVSDDFQVGYSNNISLLIAASKKLPVQIINQGALAGKTDKEAWADLLVSKDSPIKSAKDIEGKTIAVNTLNNSCEVTINASLEKQGVDITKLKFVEVPFPDMNASLDAKRVDAACEAEPFVTEGKAEGKRGIDPFYVRTAPDLSVASYFTSKQYAEQNPGVVDRFTRAMNKSLTYAQSHPDEARSVLGDYTKIPPALARKIKLPVWREDLNKPTIELLSRLSKKYGLIETEPDLDELIREPDGK